MIFIHKFLREFDTRRADNNTISKINLGSVFGIDTILSSSWRFPTFVIISVNDEKLKYYVSNWTLESFFGQFGVFLHPSKIDMFYEKTILFQHSITWYFNKLFFHVCWNSSMLNGISLFIPTKARAMWEGPKKIIVKRGSCFRKV